MFYNLIHSLLRETVSLNCYGLFSFFLFFGFFFGVIVWALTLKKKDLDKMGALPLDGGEETSDNEIKP
jgi:cbb3-type cytochrome oxidase subunit 3